MVLVDYSDSESESEPQSRSHRASQLRAPSADPWEKEGGSVKKRKRTPSPDHGSLQHTTLPALPPTFYSLYATNVRASTGDDPSLHGGRKRQTPHLEGSWPTHVYLEWYPSKTESAILEGIISRTKLESTVHTAISQDEAGSSTSINSLLQSDLGAQLPLHVSLSAPIVLQTDQRASFLESVEQALKSSSLGSFKLSITSLDWIPNFDRTRWFLVLRLSRPENDGLNKLLALTNCCVQSLGLPTLYADREFYAKDVSGPRTTRDLQALKRKPRGQLRRLTNEFPDCSSCFHISIAWRLEEPTHDQKAVTNAPTTIAEAKNLCVECGVLKVKIGNVVNDMCLPN